MNIGILALGVISSRSPGCIHDAEEGLGRRLLWKRLPGNVQVVPASCDDVSIVLSWLIHHLMWETPLGKFVGSVFLTVSANLSLFWSFWLFADGGVVICQLWCSHSLVFQQRYGDKFQSPSITISELCENHLLFFLVASNVACHIKKWQAKVIQNIPAVTRGNWDQCRFFLCRTYTSGILYAHMSSYIHMYVCIYIYVVVMQYTYTH